MVYPLYILPASNYCQRLPADAYIIFVFISVELCGVASEFAVLASALTPPRGLQSPRLQPRSRGRERPPRNRPTLGSWRCPFRQSRSSRHRKPCGTCPSRVCCALLFLLSINAQLDTYSLRSIKRYTRSLTRKHIRTLPETGVAFLECITVALDEDSAS